MGKSRRIVFQLLFGDFIFKFLPVDHKMVLFSSFYGQHYSDGPRAISEHLHQTHPDIQIYWAFESFEQHKLPSYVRAVSMDSIAYFRVKATAGFIVTNVYHQCGILGQSCPKNLLQKLHLLLENRKNQSILTTWHGTPLKKMGKDEVGAKNSSFICNIPFYYVVGNVFEEKIMSRLTDHKMKSLIWGSPRSVALIHPDPVRVMHIKEQLGIDEDTRLVLFAPTFRYGEGKKGVDVFNSGINQIGILRFDELADVLKEHFGGDRWVLMCRFHNLVERSVDWGELNKKYGGLIRNGNELEDIADYYLCSDMLITDYSSAMFDFMHSKKPVFLLCHDCKNYEETERGLYFQPDELPFPIARNYDELKDELVTFNISQYQANINKFRQMLGYVDESEDVLDRIVNLLANGETT